MTCYYVLSEWIYVHTWKGKENTENGGQKETMTINDAMRTYRLPNPTTPENLECRWSKLLTFGDKVVIAGYFYNGQNKPC